MKKSSYTYDDLISCANGDLFGPGNEKLPAPPRWSWRDFHLKPPAPSRKKNPTAT